MTSLIGYDCVLSEEAVEKESAINQLAARLSEPREDETAEDKEDAGESGV